MNEENGKWNEINDIFKLPICYNQNTVELKKNIITDLELINTVDSSTNPIYSYYFNNDKDNEFSQKIVEQIAKYYTTDAVFLEDTQKFLKDYKRPFSKYTDYSPNYSKIIDMWGEIKIESGFKEKYYYVDWEIFDFLNKSSTFLQFISIYNLFSPILCLFIPIIMLIIPFFIIKAKGCEITINEYLEVLKIIAKHNAIGRLITTNFSEINVQELVYILISSAFYIFSIYQNIMVCVRFNNNMYTIHTYFKEMKIYLHKSIETMENYLSFSNNLTSYSNFNSIIREKITTLKIIYNKILNISEYSIYNINKIAEIGDILKYFYELHSDKIYEDAIIYSFGFNGYIDCIEGLINNIEDKNINFAQFLKRSKTKKQSFEITIMLV